MHSWTRSRLADHEMIRKFTATIANDWVSTAELLADFGEVDARQLYLQEGYPSMFQSCLERHHMSEDCICKRTRAAKTAREFPAIFDMLAAGRLNLSAVLQLRTYLCADNAAELLAAAAHKTRVEIDLLLAERFPKADVPTRVEAIAPEGDLLSTEQGEVGS